jgi:NAD(P)-dependent dehydrogenase (short-subunit alcohol dehydrogenase family)
MSDHTSALVFLVLGGTGGIGSAVAQLLNASGHQVVVAARNRERLAEIASSVGGTPVVMDATNSSEVEATVAGVVEKYGRLDGVAHCIGSLHLKPAHLTSDADWNSVIALNLSSAFYTLRAAAMAMRKNGGSIVLSSSVAGRRGLINHEAISAAKAGIIGLTLSAAATYAPSRIRVNCVAPALVRTPMTSPITNSDLQLKASTAMHPLGRIGDPADVARAITWLLSPEQSWVTGQVLGVDGGLGSVQARAA